MVSQRVSVAASTSTSYCVSSGPTLAYSHTLFATLLLPGLDDDLGMLFRIGQFGERALHAFQPDMTSDQRRHVHLALGDMVQALGKLLAGIGQHELDVQLFDDAEERFEPIGLHAYADHDDARISRCAVDDLL